MTCTVEACARPVKSVGLCSAHYFRRRTHGDVLAHIPVRETPQDPGVLSPTPPDPDGTGWAAKAACRGYPPDWWHPTVGHTPTARRAKELCQLCPVQAECLADAPRGYGIYGGLDPNERLKENHHV